MITYSRTNQFEPSALERLFLSVGWFSGKFPDKLAAAFRNTDAVFSAWEGDRLVGVLRALSDGVWQANIDCLIVDPQYQKRGIASELIRQLREELCGLLYISVAPEDAKNCGFYEKQGFHIVEGGATMVLENHWKN